MLLIALSALSLSSCNLFLEMPEVTGSVYLDDVFSNRKDAEGMLWRTYHMVCVKVFRRVGALPTVLLPAFRENSREATPGTADI